MITATKPALVVTRLIDAPRERVFAAWTDAEEVKGWWGPRTFTTPVVTVDLRPGGESHLAMESPEGDRFWCKGIFLDIEAPARYLATCFFSNEEGGKIEPVDFGMPAGWPSETLIEVTFDDVDGKTRLTMRNIGLTEEMIEAVQCRQGWNESFDRLEEYLRDGKVAS